MKEEGTEGSACLEYEGNQRVGVGARGEGTCALSADPRSLPWKGSPQVSEAGAPRPAVSPPPPPGRVLPEASQPGDGWGVTGAGVGVLGARVAVCARLLVRICAQHRAWPTFTLTHVRRTPRRKSPDVYSRQCSFTSSLKVSSQRQTPSTTEGVAAAGRIMTPYGS